MNWTLHIERVKNGYVLHGQEDETGEPCTWVIEEDDELFAHETLLWDVMNYFAFQGKESDPERLKIIRVKKGK